MYICILCTRSIDARGSDSSTEGNITPILVVLHIYMTYKYVELALYNVYFINVARIMPVQRFNKLLEHVITTFLM